MNVRPCQAGDWSELVRMANALFPDFAGEDEDDLRKTLGSCGAVHRLTFKTTAETARVLSSGS